MSKRWLFACVGLWFAAGCGDSDASGGGGSGGGQGANGAGGSIDPPPVPGACVAPIEPADVSTPTTVVGSGPGTCDEASLDAAVAAGGVIVFDCGPDPVTIPVTTEKRIVASTVIDGGGLVTLDAMGATRIFVVETEVDLTVQHLGLKGARVSAPRGDGPGPSNSGAAVYRRSATRLVVIDVQFADNHATDSGADIGGGAIYSHGGDTIVVGSTFDGNSGSSGGAIGNLRSNLAIYNSSFANNHAVSGNGGAVATDGQNPDQGKVFTLCGVVAQNNRAELEGGAIYRYGYPGESSVIDSTTLDGNYAEQPGAAHAGGLYHLTDTPGVMPLTLTNSTISNNTSANGAAGAFFYNSPVELTNVTITGNVATASLGGGIAANGVTGTLKNCTIANNHADAEDSFGGGLVGGQNLTLQNTIIAGNTAGNAWNPVSCTETASGANNMQFPPQQESGQDDTPCVGAIDFADPLLGPLADNGGPTATMALMSGSPAIGAGVDCPPTDQRGVERTNGCDLGAYQHDAN
ncbi:MAG: choice-of-anchor Q domain-containing protein [Polyangiaceae bacterium]